MNICNTLLLLIYMNLASIILDDQSVQECIQNIIVWLTCKHKRFMPVFEIIQEYIIADTCIIVLNYMYSDNEYPIMAHSKTLDTKYNLTSDYLPRVLSDLTLEYIRDDIEITCKALDDHIKIFNKSLNISISFGYSYNLGCYTNIISIFNNVKFNTINFCQIYSYNQVIPFFRYYLKTNYNIPFSFNKHAITYDPHFDSTCLHVNNNKARFNNELLIF